MYMINVGSYEARGYITRNYLLMIHLPFVVKSFNLVASKYYLRYFKIHLLLEYKQMYKIYNDSFAQSVCI